jgi:hypothetical protein
LSGLSDSAAGGIVVSESPAGEDPIPHPRDLVVAFVGPAPRGPAHIPVSVTSVEEYRRRFGSPVERSRMEWVLSQFFDNGGERAVVVRVPRSGGHNLLVLPGAGGDLELTALHPGPLEYLRASVDLDGIPPEDLWRFNLTIQRVRSPASPLVEEQEIHRALTVDPDDENYVGTVLADSRLVRMYGDPPRARPQVTPGTAGSAPGYVNCRGNWRASAPPTDYDLVGSRRDATGLCALDQVPRVDLVCLLSGSPDADVGPVALFAAERYCQERQALLLLDPPTRWRTVADALRGQRERAFASANVLTYFPWLQEPGVESRPQSRFVSAMGVVAGYLAARWRSTGGGRVVTATLGSPALLRSRSRAAVELDEEDAGALIRSGLNVLLPGAAGLLGFAGDVTLASAGGSRREWRHLPARQLALQVVGTVAQATRWSALQPPVPATWKAVVTQVSGYLAALSAEGAFVADSGRPGWYVKCDQDLNPTRGSGTTSLVIGLALQRPGAYVAFRIDHHVDRCVIAEQVWQPGLALAG